MREAAPLSSRCERTPPDETTSHGLVRKFAAHNQQTCSSQRYGRADPVRVTKVRPPLIRLIKQYRLQCTAEGRRSPSRLLKHRVMPPVLSRRADPRGLYGPRGGCHPDDTTALTVSQPPRQ